MGDRTKWIKHFYFDRGHPILNSLKDYYRWIHNNELPELKSFCPDCNWQIFHNSTMNTWLCYNCFRTFTQKDIIKISPRSKNCVYCDKKIMWWAEVCNICADKQYQLYEIIEPKLRVLSQLKGCLTESLFHYKWSHYVYEYQKDQLKLTKKLINALKGFEIFLGKIDDISSRLIPKKRKERETTTKRHKKKKRNKIENIIKLLKEEKKRKTFKANKENLDKIINWVDSETNKWKKSEAIEEILSLIKKGEKTNYFKHQWYSNKMDRGKLEDWKYILLINGDQIILIEECPSRFIYFLTKEVS